MLSSGQGSYVDKHVSGRGRRSTQVALRSVWAFMLREIQQQYGRFRTGYLWALLEPAATVAVLTGLHAGIRGGEANIYGEHPVIFFLFGAVPFFLFFGVVNRSQNAFQGTKGLFSYRQIKPIDLFVARAVIEALVVLIVGCVFIGLWLWWGEGLALRDPLLLLQSLALLFLLGVGVGLVYGVYGAIFTDLQRVFGITMRPMFFISGIFFTIQMVPQRYRHFVDWNPMLHAIDLARESVLPAYTSPASPGYALLCAAALIAFGLAAYRRYLPQLIA